MEFAKSVAPLPDCAADAHPWLRLRHAPVCEIQIGIVAAGDPGIAAGAEQVGKFSPGIAAGLALLRDGVELPDQLAGLGVIGADETFLFAVLIASIRAEALNHLPLIDDRTAAGAVTAFGAIADDGVPDVLAGARIEREYVGIAGGDVNLVVVDRHAALRVAGGGGADAIFPDQLAGSRR